MVPKTCAALRQTELRQSDVTSIQPRNRGGYAPFGPGRFIDNHVAISQLSGPNGSWTGTDDHDMCGICDFHPLTHRSARQDPIVTDRFYRTCERGSLPCAGRTCVGCVVKLAANKRHLPGQHVTTPLSCPYCNSQFQISEVFLSGVRDSHGPGVYTRAQQAARASERRRQQDQMRDDQMVAQHLAAPALGGVHMYSPGGTESFLNFVPAVNPVSATPDGVVVASTNPTAPIAVPAGGGSSYTESPFARRPRALTDESDVTHMTIGSVHDGPPSTSGGIQIPGRGSQTSSRASARLRRSTASTSVASLPVGSAIPVAPLSVGPVLIPTTAPVLNPLHINGSTPTATVVGSFSTLRSYSVNTVNLGSRQGSHRSVGGTPPSHEPDPGGPGGPGPGGGGGGGGAPGNPTAPLGVSRVVLFYKGDFSEGLKWYLTVWGFFVLLQIFCSVNPQVRENVRYFKDGGVLLEPTIILLCDFFTVKYLLVVLLWFFRLTCCRSMSDPEYGNWFGLTAESPLRTAHKQGTMYDVSGNDYTVWRNAGYTYWSYQPIYTEAAHTVINKRAGSKTTKDLLRFCVADITSMDGIVDIAIADNSAIYAYQCIVALRHREEFCIPKDATGEMPTRIW